MLRKWLLLSLMVVGLVGCNRQSASPPCRKTKAVILAGEVGSRLPDFAVEDMQGRKISSASLLESSFRNMLDPLIRF